MQWVAPLVTRADIVRASGALAVPAACEALCETWEK